MAGLAADPAQRALGGAQREILHGIAAAIDVVVDHHAGVGPDGELGTVLEEERADARGIGAEALVAVDGIARRKRARLPSDADGDFHRLANLVRGRCRRGERRHSDEPCQDEPGKTRSCHAVTPLHVSLLRKSTHSTAPRSRKIVFNLRVLRAAVTRFLEDQATAHRGQGVAR